MFLLFGTIAAFITWLLPGIVLYLVFGFPLIIALIFGFLWGSFVLALLNCLDLAWFTRLIRNKNKRK
jgi:hypothetical protein